jgi:hypothetical protein
MVTWPTLHPGDSKPNNPRKPGRDRANVPTIATASWKLEMKRKPRPLATCDETGPFTTGPVRFESAAPPHSGSPEAIVPDSPSQRSV